GLYYLSLAKDGEPGEGMAFANLGEIEAAREAGVVTLHSKVRARYVTVDAEGNRISSLVETTPGRMLIGEHLPRHPEVPFDLINRLLTKKEIGTIIDVVYRHTGQKATVIFCDKIMGLGFKEAAKAGISFGKDDMVIPDEKRKLVEQTRSLV